MSNTLSTTQPPPPQPHQPATPAAPQKQQANSLLQQLSPKSTIMFPLEVFQLFTDVKHNITIVEDNAIRPSFAPDSSLSRIKFRNSNSRLVTRHSSNDVAFDRWGPRLPENDKSNNRSNNACFRSNSIDNTDPPVRRQAPRRSKSADELPQMPVRRPFRRAPSRSNSSDGMSMPRRDAPRRPTRRTLPQRPPPLQRSTRDARKRDVCPVMPSAR